MAPTKRASRSSNNVSDAAAPQGKKARTDAKDVTSNQGDLQAAVQQHHQEDPEEVDQLSGSQHQSHPHSVSEQQANGMNQQGQSGNQDTSHSHASHSNLLSYPGPGPGPGPGPSDGNRHEASNGGHGNQVQSSHVHHYGPPLGTLEPSAERYLQASNGRRGSTDPILHASLAAAASANVGTSSAERRPSIPTNYPTYEDPGFYPQYPPPHYPMMPPPHSEMQHHHHQQQHHHHHSHHPALNHQHQHHQNPPFMHSSPQHPHSVPSNHPLSIPNDVAAAPAPPPASASSETGGEDSEKPAKNGTGSTSSGKKETPFSRSPDMRVSHATAERKRRQDMKELFDELKQILPNDKGNKTSKWEILQRALETIRSLEESQRTLKAENEQLRNELAFRQADPATSYAAERNDDGEQFQNRQE